MIKDPEWFFRKIKEAEKHIKILRATQEDILSALKSMEKEISKEKEVKEYKKARKW